MSVYIKRSAFYITYILIFLQVLCSKFKELFRKKKKEHHLKRLNNKKGFDSSIVYCSVFFYLSNKSFMFGCCFNFCFIFFKYNYLGFPTLPQVFNFSVLLRQKKLRTNIYMVSYYFVFPWIGNGSKVLVGCSIASLFGENTQFPKHNCCSLNFCEKLYRSIIY